MDVDRDNLWQSDKEVVCRFRKTVNNLYLFSLKSFIDQWWNVVRWSDFSKEYFEWRKMFYSSDKILSILHKELKGTFLNRSLERSQEYNDEFVTGVCDKNPPHSRAK